MLKPLATLPVFFLKAKPKIQIFLSVMVLNKHSTILWANLILKDSMRNIWKYLEIFYLWKLLKLTT